MERPHGPSESPLRAPEDRPFALLAAALADIYRRPAEEIRDNKWPWVAAAFVNIMGIGPIAYFLFGRKRA